MSAESIETHVPKRLDRLPWSRWHWLVVFALGFVWILDGLEVNEDEEPGSEVADELVVRGPQYASRTADRREALSK